MVEDKKFRIAEIFGPTIQGEGRRIGTPCHFIRFGGCDFRCTWCDSPHAVLPDLVAQLEQMTVEQIMSRLRQLNRYLGDWVVYSGGNPGLLNLEELTHRLHLVGCKIMLETQASTFRKWYGDIDDLCFSPKPPSSGNTSDLNLLDRVIEATIEAQVKSAKERWNDPFLLPYLKIPIFNDEDYEYAREAHMKHYGLEMFLSVGNDDPTLPTVGNPDPPQMREHAHRETAGHVIKKMRWLMEKVTGDRDMRDVRVTPQLHVLAWGNQRGR
jgi:7-carboxy-7-deazaguanine synthase